MTQCITDIQTFLDEKFQMHIPPPYPAQCMCAETLIRVRQCTILFYFRVCMLRNTGGMIDDLQRSSDGDESWSTRTLSFLVRRNLELGGSRALIPVPPIRGHLSRASNLFVASLGE